MSEKVCIGAYSQYSLCRRSGNNSSIRVSSVTDILPPLCVCSVQVVLAMARFPNVAESTEELSFGQGELVSILQKDTGIGNWWLCQAAGKVGLVPANYLEEVTASGSLQAEEVPAVTVTLTQSPTATTEHVYDHIPAQLQTEYTNGEDDKIPLKRSLASSHSLPSFVAANVKDSRNSRVSDPGNGLYDVPRSVLAQTQNSLTQSADSGRYYQTPSQDVSHIYDELPLQGRYPSPGPAHSSLYDTPRRYNNGIYQVPTSALAASSGTYDVPRSNEPVRSSDDGYFSPKRESVLPLSIEMMTADDACRRMAQLNEEINRTWDDLVESVYNARWDGAFRELTAARTIAATQAFDNHLNAFMEFIKGVINSLMQAKGDDANRQKFASHYSKLHETRVDLLEKLGYLQDGSGDIEKTAQDLISNGLGMLQTVRELDILVRAFRSVIFKQSTPDGLTKPGSYSSASLDVRQMRRKPTDALPPTPTSNMSDTEMMKNLEKVKNYSRNISGGKNWGDTQRTLASQPRSRPWGSHDDLLSSSTQQAPLGVHYVSPMQGRNPYDPHRRHSAGSSGSSASSPVPNFDGPVRLTEEDRLCVETYTREFVGSLPELIRSVQKLRVCVEEAKNQALHRATNGGDESAKSQILACCGDVVKVGHCIVMQADTVFRKLDNEPAREAVAYSTNSITVGLKELGSSAKAAVLQYPNLAAINNVGTSVEQVRSNIVALGKLLKEFVSGAN